eukprot:COSAG01_NODE_7373_length_3232_cov_4.371360_2_plen_82_part_00
MYREKDRITGIDDTRLAQKAMAYTRAAKAMLTTGRQHTVWNGQVTHRGSASGEHRLGCARIGPPQALLVVVRADCTLIEGS